MKINQTFQKHSSVKPKETVQVLIILKALHLKRNIKLQNEKLEILSIRTRSKIAFIYKFG